MNPDVLDEIREDGTAVEEAIKFADAHESDDGDDAAGGDGAVAVDDPPASATEPVAAAVEPQGDFGDSHWLVFSRRGQQVVEVMGLAGVGVLMRTDQGPATLIKDALVFEAAMIDGPAPAGLMGPDGRPVSSARPVIKIVAREIVPLALARKNLRQANGTLPADVVSGAVARRLVRPQAQAQAQPRAQANVPHPDLG